MHTIKALLTLAILGGVALLCGGCAAVKHSQDVRGEHVDIRMLTVTDLDNYHDVERKDLESDDFLLAFGEEQPKAFEDAWRELRDSVWIKTGPDRSPVLLPLLPALAAGIANLLVDQIVTELDAEASRYEGQYGASRAFDGFWQGVEADAWTPEYVGFEIIRYTERFPPGTKQDDPRRGGASRMIVLFARSQSDPRLFLLHPFFYANRSAKAKVDLDGVTIAVTTSIKFDSVWVDRGAAINEAEIASATFQFGGYPMRVDRRGIVLMTKPKEQAVGWFVGVPVSTNANGDPVSEGVFRITALVTERDESRARERIERSSKFVSSRRDRIVEQINEVLPKSEK